MKSNEKGGEFERRIARLLSEWLTGGVSDRVLWRTPGSGAAAHHLPAAQARWIGGDIGVLDHDCHLACTYVERFHTELKHYRKLEWHQAFLTRDKGFIWETWYKTKRLAEGRVPLVILKQNFQTEAVLAPPSFLRRLAFRHVSLFEEAGLILLKDLLERDASGVIDEGYHWCREQSLPRKKILRS